jgi:antitoxin ParD1/3/4
MPTRNINLTEHLDRLIQSEVGSGKFGNASEVVREGLRLIERRNQEDLARLAWLRGAVNEGLSQIARGEGMEFRSVDELDLHLDQIGNELSAEVSGNGKRAKIR